MIAAKSNLNGAAWVKVFWKSETDFLWLWHNDAKICCELHTSFLHNYGVQLNVAEQRWHTETWSGWADNRERK